MKFYKVFLVTLFFLCSFNLYANEKDKILNQLEKSHSSEELTGKATSKLNSPKSDKMQMSFFQLDDPILESIRDEIKLLDINTLTPVEALMKLNEIKKLVNG